VQIAARRRHAGVAERGLHFSESGAAIERVAAVRMAQPVRRYCPAIPAPFAARFSMYPTVRSVSR
jgi:hypothetical protein